MGASSDRSGSGLDRRQDHRSDPDAEAALSGWDPYIVAITGGETPSIDTNPAPVERRKSTPATESGWRELRVVDWLRRHGPQGAN